jgi:hypothetical protein
MFEKEKENPQVVVTVADVGVGSENPYKVLHTAVYCFL